MDEGQRTRVKILLGQFWTHLKHNWKIWLALVLLVFAIIPRSSEESRDYAVEKEENSRECPADFGTVEQLLASAVPGDLIEIKRNYKALAWWYYYILRHRPNSTLILDINSSDQYDHWGVYVGNFELIHNTPYGILKEKVEDVVHGSLCRVNNLDESAASRHLKAHSKTQTVTNAYKYLNQFNAADKLNHGYKYNLSNFNCQHFATLCRYGESFSDMIEILEDKPMLKMLASALNFGSERFF